MSLANGAHSGGDSRLIPPISRISVIPLCLDDLVTFVFRDEVDGLRCRETCWLLARHEELVRVQRQAHAEDLAVLRVLDERGRAAEALAADGISTRTAREMVETARSLESLPEVAAAAHAGCLSDEQLVPVVALADETSDAEWVERAAHTSPVDLHRQVRTQTTPTLEDSRARQDARCLNLWWDPSHSMLNIRGALPDLMGAEFEQVITAMVEQMKPPPGGTWDSFEHRAADSLLELCRRTTSARDATSHHTTDPHATEHTPTLAPKAVLVVDVPLKGAATVAGIPLPGRNGRTTPRQRDDRTGSRRRRRRPPRHRSTPCFAVVEDHPRRAARDGHCRCPGCDRRHGLEIHHLVPRSWGGTDDIAHLAAVCATHHRQLIPHGPWVLIGNPNQPDGLRLIRYDQLTDDLAREYGLPPPPRRRRT